MKTLIELLGRLILGIGFIVFLLSYDLQSHLESGYFSSLAPYSVHITYTMIVIIVLWIGLSLKEN